MNADPVTAMIFYEQIARGSVGFAQSVIMNILMGTYFVYRFGSEAIKKRCLYPAMKGERSCHHVLYRGPVRFRPFGNEDDGRQGRERMGHQRDEDVDHQRPLADIATVLATTDLSMGAKALNFFLVEKGTPGFAPGQIIDKLGCRGTITGELVFDNVRVPEENLLGCGIEQRR